MSACGKRAEPIRVAVVADTTGAAGEIARGLRDSGYAVRSFSLGTVRGQDRVRELHPRVVLLRTSTRSFSLASAFARIAANGGPALVLLTPAGSQQAVKLALAIGAFVHLLEPVPAQALTAAVRLAAARAEDMRQLKRRLTGIRESLQDRKVLDRAKAVLMRRFGLSEEQAHRMLQRESRNRNRKLTETAWHVIRADARISGGPRSSSTATSGWV
ncbi:MAG: ANTAR domain-containing protein [Armatimonadota bacterium]|nr:MAG: ANTAR domain-containing protein [Armatimonadota bacterium]